MKIETTRAALATVLAVSLGALGCSEAKADRTESTASKATPAPTAAPIPKTDRIAMAEFKKMYAANDVVVVDVRSHDSYLAGHIPGSLSIPLSSITAETAEKLKRLGKPVATYCA